MYVNLALALRRCNRCSEWKPVEAFALDRSKKSGRRGRCYPCQASYWREWAGENRDRHRAAVRAYRAKPGNQLKRRLAQYGLTVDAAESFLSSQNGSCAICGAPIALDDGSACVDHCHATDEVRGLLCRKCNAAIGLLGDDAATVAAALRYLQSPREC